MLATCLAAVFSLMTRLAATSRLLWPDGDETEDLHLAGSQAARRCVAGVEIP